MHQYRINFHDIKQRYQRLSHGERLNILKHFAFGGEVIGCDYVVRCPWRSDNKAGSFRIKLATGCYHDFASGDKGDLIDFAAKCDNCRPYAAADKVLSLMGGNSSLASSSIGNGNYEPAKKRYPEASPNKDSKPDFTSFIWGKSVKRDHPYLHEKRVSLGNARVNFHGDLNRIVAPMTDTVPGNESGLEVKTLHFIYEDGTKGFNREILGLFHIASEYDCDKSVVVICEGFATARSIAESVPGLYVVACMPACNMKPVALRIRELLPASRIVLAADVNANQVGQKAAEESVQALGDNCEIIYPTQGVDFNDAFKAIGKDNLKKYITGKLNNNKEIIHGK